PLPGAVPPTPRPTSRPRGRLSLLRPSISRRTFVTGYGESLRTSPRILDGAPSNTGWGWSADGAQVTRNQPAASRASLCADPTVGSSVSSASPNASKVRKPRVPMRHNKATRRPTVNAGFLITPRLDFTNFLRGVASARENDEASRGRLEPVDVVARPVRAGPSRVVRQR